MAGDSLGKIFKVTNWGESHGPSVGIVLEGCPPGLVIDERQLQKEMDRRRPGQSDLTTPRQEPDRLMILSGIKNGMTTGTPIAMMVKNVDQKSVDYSEMKNLFRPSHADFTYFAKYGLREETGGGRSSARVTTGTVAAGAIAKQMLAQWFDVKVLGFVVQIGKVRANVGQKMVTEVNIERNFVRCPDEAAAVLMTKAIEVAKKDKDSLGGVVECRVFNSPVGLGEPIYDKLEADLAKAVLGINACKGFEIGSGFAGCEMRGSEHNDEFVEKDGNIETSTNHSGGVQGGISNGMPIVFRAAFKPTSTIGKMQKTVSTTMKEDTLAAKGRHDPCVLPRAVPIVEASVALVLADHALRHRGQVGKFYSSSK